MLYGSLQGQQIGERWSLRYCLMSGADMGPRSTKQMSLLPHCIMSQREVNKLLAEDWVM